MALESPVNSLSLSLSPAVPRTVPYVQIGGVGDVRRKTQALLALPRLALPCLALPYLALPCHAMQCQPHVCSVDGRVEPLRPGL